MQFYMACWVVTSSIHRHIMHSRGALLSAGHGWPLPSCALHAFDDDKRPLQLVRSKSSSDAKQQTMLLVGHFVQAYLRCVMVAQAMCLAARESVHLMLRHGQQYIVLVAASKLAEHPSPTAVAHALETCGYGSPGLFGHFDHTKHSTGCMQPQCSQHHTHVALGSVRTNISRSVGVYAHGGV